MSLSWAAQLPAKADEGQYVYWSAGLIADVPAGVVMVTLTVPVPPLGEQSHPRKLGSQVQGNVWVPNRIDVGSEMFSPLISTLFPAGVPTLGLTPVITGGREDALSVKMDCSTSADDPAEVVTYT